MGMGISLSVSPLLHLVDSSLSSARLNEMWRKEQNCVLCVLALSLFSLLSSATSLSLSLSLSRAPIESCALFLPLYVARAKVN